MSVEAAAQQAAQAAGPVALRQGLVVDLARGVAFVMTPEGRITALDLATGAARWTSSDAAQPLAVVGNVLVSQVEAAGGRLELVALNGESGARVARGGVDLPAGVRASVGETLEGTFTVAVRPSAGAAIVMWSFVPAPRRGADVVDTAQRAAPGQRAGPPGIRGAVRMNLATGAVTPATPRDTAGLGAAPRPRWTVPAAQKIAGAADAQYESADGRYVLASARVGDDRVWDQYRWTVYERSTGRQVGEMRTHVSFAPFVVRDSLLIYETAPYARRAEEEPAKLRAVSLRTGQERWSVPVREVVYRGPFPP